jgi:hypothetical protein
MASAPPTASLPLFYRDLVPLNSRDHADFKSRTTDRALWLVNQHAVPLTVEEFPQAQRHFPIVFSSGENPVPLALMGLNEGVNVFVDAEGKLSEAVYIPAYARRYPFMLAKLTPDASELSLCFDPSTDLVGAFDEGAALFADAQPTDTTKALLGFCEHFEQAGLRTAAFLEELKKHDLLMDGEVAIQQEGHEQPFIYRGFQMINQEKLRDVRGDVLRGWNQSGLLALVFAHLFSLELMREIFAKQAQQGKGPVALPA